jgi:uncharacterized protein YcbK (DUF882 family)
LITNQLIVSVTALLPIIFKIRVMTTAMAGWSAAASPVPIPAEAFATIVAGHASSPVAVDLYDENEHQKGHVAIWRDGSTDEETAEQLKHLFRCRRTYREHTIAQQTLAMLAAVSEHFAGRTIEYVSAYRVGREESRTSPHRHATAIDFRIRGVHPSKIRDYVWRTYSGIGVGWYPDGQYIHMDTRPDKGDTAWTFVKGSNRYHPYWAELARRLEIPERVASHSRPGS